MFGDPVSGWPSLICIITFIGGTQLLSIGILGQYLAKTYLETKRRPIYIIRSRENQNKESQKYQQKVLRNEYSLTPILSSSVSPPSIYSQICRH